MKHQMNVCCNNCKVKRIILLIFLLLVNLFTGNTYSQIPDTVKKWNLQDCFQYATQNNIQLNLLRLSEQSSQQDIIAAKGLRTPSLSGTVGNTFENANNANPSTGSLANQLTTSGAYSLNSSIVLWNDHYITNNIKEENLVTQSAGLSIAETQNNITLAITQAYLNILLAKENLKYFEDLVTTSQARVTQGQQFFDVGTIAKKDLLQLQATLASDKFLMVQTRITIRQDILVLKQLLQLPTATAFDIDSSSSLTVNRTLPPLNDVEHAALGNFPEIKIGQLGLNISSLEIAKAKAGFKPILKANAALGTEYNSAITNPFPGTVGYFTQTGDNFYQLAGVTLSVPIFSNKINEVNLAKANIGYKEASLNLENSELVLSQQVEQAYLNAQNALESYDAANEQLESATESYRVVNEELKIGSVDAVDLLTQQNQYIQAVQAFTMAKYTAILQQKIYEFYTGNPITL
jgi:outer membrane protein